MIAVIADDITGAAEVAGVCLRRGVSVRMLLGVPAAEDLGGDGVLVLATNTRAGEREQACAAMRAIAVRLREAGITEVFKKTDSALRGWVLGEMGSLARELGRSRLLIQPANLETGRTIRDGIYHVQGIPIADTPFRDDPEFPARCSEAARLLRERDAQGKEAAVPFLIPDAQREEDMAYSAAQCTPEDLPGGSASFWKYYLDAEIARGRIIASAQAVPAPSGLDLGAALIVCGSAHPASRAWCRTLAGSGFPTMEIPRELCLSGQDDSLPAREWSQQCIARWRENGRLLVRSADEAIQINEDPGRPGRRLAECAARLIDAVRPAELLVEGGETAWETFRRLGWTRFTPVREWSPGVVSLELDSPHTCMITLKPGSYAWPHINQL